jgi:hypothetical protein
MNNDLTQECNENSPTEPASASEETKSFRDFIRQHYVQTRGMPVTGICVGILAAPALSLAKPFFAVRGLVLVVLAIVGLWGLGRCCHALGRLIDFYCRRRTEVPPAAKSFPAQASYFCKCLLILVAPVVVLECITPERGALVAVLPALGDLQAPFLSGSDQTVASSDLVTDVLADDVTPIMPQPLE